VDVGLCNKSSGGGQLPLGHCIRIPQKNKTSGSRRSHATSAQRVLPPHDALTLCLWQGRPHARCTCTLLLPTVPIPSGHPVRL